MRTTALTKYQKHVRDFSKTYSGKPKNMMKAAAKEWRKITGATKKKPKKSSPKKTGGKKTVAKKKKKKGRSGFRLPGGLGPKGVIFGALGLTAARMLVPTQSGGVQKAAAGMGLRALKIGGGGPLAAAGIIEIVADLIAGVMSGGGLGISGATVSGGSDY